MCVPVIFNDIFMYLFILFILMLVYLFRVGCGLISIM